MKDQERSWFISVLERIWMNFQDTGMGMGRDWDGHGEEVGMGPAFELMHDILGIIH